MDAGLMWLSEGEFLCQRDGWLLRRRRFKSGINYLGIEQANGNCSWGGQLQRCDGSRRQVRLLVEGGVQRIAGPARFVVPVALLVRRIQNDGIGPNLEMPGFLGDPIGKGLRFLAGREITGTDFTLVMRPDVHRKELRYDCKTWSGDTGNPGMAILTHPDGTERDAATVFCREAGWLPEDQWKKRRTGKDDGTGHC
jgi:diadenosine tetraphosphatase ApaH/serine/threonine PP2A family protein phosphatase